MRRCIQCQGPIPTARKRGSTYCSDTCSYQVRLARRNAVVRAARAANPNTRTCPTCKKEFHARGRMQYCAPSCRPTRTETRKPVVCPTCKASFTPRNSRHKYCTPTCNTNTAPRAKLTPRICANKNCGNTFTARGTQKYCTPACRAPRYTPRSTPRPCNTCGTKFMPRHGPERYCSDQCRETRNQQQAARRAAQHTAERPLAKRQWSDRQATVTISMLTPDHADYNPRIMGKPVNEQLRILARESDPTFTTWFLEGVADVAGIHELRARILAQTRRQ